MDTLPIEELASNLKDIQLLLQKTNIAHLAGLMGEATAIIQDLEEYCPTQDQSKAHQQLQELFSSAKDDLLEDKGFNTDPLKRFIGTLIEDQKEALFARATCWKLFDDTMGLHARMRIKSVGSILKEIKIAVQEKNWVVAKTKLDSFSDYIDQEFRSFPQEKIMEILASQDSLNQKMLENMQHVGLEEASRFAQEIKEIEVNGETDVVSLYKKKFALYNRMKAVDDKAIPIYRRRRGLDELLRQADKHDHGPSSLSCRGFVYIRSRFDELARSVVKTNDLAELNKFASQEAPERIKIFSQIYSQETFFTELKSEAEKIIAELEKDHQDCTRAREILGEWVTAFEGINRNSSVHDYGFPEGLEHFDAGNRMSSALHGLQVFKDLQQERLENVKKRRPMEAFEIDESEMKRPDPSTQSTSSAGLWGRSRSSVSIQSTPVQARTGFALRPGTGSVSINA